MSQPDIRSTSSNNYRISVGEVLGLLSRSIAAGLDLKAFLEPLKLADNCLSDPTADIALEDCWRILNAHYNMVAEESHQLAKRPLTRGTTRLIFNNLLHCNTLEDGLHSLAESYNVVHGGDFNSIRKHGNTISFVVDDRDFPYSAESQCFAIEIALLGIHGVLSFLTQKPLKVVRFSTPRKTLPDYNHHLNLFNAKIRLGHEVYEMVYDVEQISLPLIIDDDMDFSGNIFAYNMSMLRSAYPDSDSDGDPFGIRVKQLIADQFARNQPRDQGLIAEKLHMSVATLRRRLQDSRVSFRALIDEASAEVAVNVLYEYKSIDVAATALGYSEIRGFKRAFRRWHGETPAEFLKSHNIIPPKKPL